MSKIERAIETIDDIISELIDMSIDVAECGNESLAEDILEMVNGNMEYIRERLDDTAKERRRKAQKQPAKVLCTIDIYSGEIDWNR